MELTLPSLLLLVFLHAAAVRVIPVTELDPNVSKNSNVFLQKRCILPSLPCY